MPSNSQGVVKTQLTESSQPSSVPIHNVSSVSRPPSNYGSRSQEIVGSQKGIILDKPCMPQLLLCKLEQCEAAKKKKMSQSWNMRLQIISA